MAQPAQGFFLAKGCRQTRKPVLVRRSERSHIKRGARFRRGANRSGGGTTILRLGRSWEKSHNLARQAMTAAGTCAWRAPPSPAGGVRRGPQAHPEAPPLPRCHPSGGHSRGFSLDEMQNPKKYLMARDLDISCSNASRGEKEKDTR